MDTNGTNGTNGSVKAPSVAPSKPQKHASGVSPISGTAPPEHTRWKPGVSPNPGGKPKNTPSLSHRVIALLAKGPAVLETEPKDVADALALAWIRKAMDGSERALSDLADRIDGRVIQKTEVSTGPIALEWGDDADRG